MPTRKRKIEDEDQVEPIVAATDPHVTPPPAEKVSDDNAVAEYRTPDGLTFMLTAKEAERRGAKAVKAPSNKAVTPNNK